MKNKLVVPLLVFSLLLGSAIFGIWKYAQHAEVARVQDMTTELFAGGTDEQRRANWEGFRAANEGLSESQQQQVRASMREMGQVKMQERFASFFAMTPEQKRARLDEDINRMRDRKKEMATRQKEREASGETGGKRGGPGGPGDKGQGGDKGKRGDREDDGRTDEERRDDRRRRMLDHTEPEMRAQMSEYREELHARMKDRGLDPDDFRGPGGRPGGGRPGGGRRG